MTDDVRALRDADAALDRLAARRPGGPSLEATDCVLLALAALADEVDRTPLPAYDAVTGPSGRRRRRGRRRSLGAVVAVGFMVSSTGLAAAVTGDPLLPFTFVVRQVSDLRPDAPSVEPDWISGHHVISSPSTPAAASAPTRPKRPAHPHPRAAGSDWLALSPPVIRPSDSAAPFELRAPVAAASQPVAPVAASQPVALVDSPPDRTDASPRAAGSGAPQAPAERPHAHAPVQRRSPEPPAADPPAQKSPAVQSPAEEPTAEEPAATEPPAERLPLEELISASPASDHPAHPFHAPPNFSCPDPGTADGEQAACEHGEADSDTPPGEHPDPGTPPGEHPDPGTPPSEQPDPGDSSPGVGDTGEPAGTDRSGEEPPEQPQQTDPPEQAPTECSSVDPSDSSAGG